MEKEQFANINKVRTSLDDSMDISSVKNGNLMNLYSEFRIPAATQYNSETSKFLKSEIDEDDSINEELEYKVKDKKMTENSEQMICYSPINSNKKDILRLVEKDRFTNLQSRASFSKLKLYPSSSLKVDHLPILLQRPEMSPPVPMKIIKKPKNMLLKPQTFDMLPMNYSPLRSKRGVSINYHSIRSPKNRRASVFQPTISELTEFKMFKIFRKAL